MKKFLKYFGLAFAFQVLLLIIVGAIDSGFRGHGVLDQYIMVYAPFMLLIYRLGHYTGEAGMIDPVLKGLPLGIFVYSVLAGAAGVGVNRLRRGGSS